MRTLPGFACGWAGLLCLTLPCRPMNHLAEATSSDDHYRRCRSLSKEPKNDNSLTSPALREFYNSTCEICPNDYPSTTVRTASNKTRAVVLLTAQETFEKALTITVGLLTSGNRVTIITGPGMPEHHLIREGIFHAIPCEKHGISSILLTFKSYTLESSGASHCDISCSLQNAVPTVEAFSAVFDQVSEPSVLVLDAMSVAGM